MALANAMPMHLPLPLPTLPRSWSCLFSAILCSALLCGIALSRIFAFACAFAFAFSRILIAFAFSGNAKVQSLGLFAILSYSHVCWAKAISAGLFPSKSAAFALATII